MNMKLATFGILLLSLVTPLQAQVPDLVPAFYGVRGHGYDALDTARDSVRAGAWPLKVYKVNSTACTGDGTFASILQDSVRTNQPAYHVVLFDRGGTTDIGGGCLSNNRLEANNIKHVRVAGQTAPGGGWQVTGTYWYGKANNNDILLEYFAWRSRGANNIYTIGDRWVMRNMSFAWAGTAGGHQVLTIGGDTTAANNRGGSTNIGLQQSILCQPDVRHATILAVSGEPKTMPPVRNVSVWRNFLCGPGWRTPVCQAINVQIVNNVVYNQYQDAYSYNNEAVCDFVANFIKGGPATSTTGINAYQRTWQGRCVADKSGDGLTEGDGVCTVSIMFENERYWDTGYDPTPNTDSLWRGSKRLLACNDSPSGCVNAGDTVPMSHRRYIRLDDTAIPVLRPPITDSVLTVVLDSVGANRALNCDGSWYTRRDSADSTFLAQFADSSGLSAPDTTSEFTLPTKAAGTACSDSDDDGLPNAWEVQYTGSSSDSTSYAADSDDDGDGWLAIDEYLQGTSPEAFEAWPATAAPRRRRYYLLAYQLQPSGRYWYKQPGTATAIPDTIKLSPYQFNDSLDIIVTYDSIEGTSLLPIETDSLQALCATAGLNCARIESRDVPGASLSTNTPEGDSALPLLAAALPAGRRRRRG